MTATTVWLDRATHARLVAAKQKFGVTSLGQVIQALLDAPQESARNLYQRRKKQVDAVCRKYGVLKLMAFGSRARGDAKPGSDLDLSAQLPPDKDLFDLMHLGEDLAQAFACSTDVIGWPTHRPRLMAQIIKDGIVLYERRAKAS